MPPSVVPTSVNEPKEPTEAENYRPATSESGSTLSMPPDVDSGSIGNGTGPEGEARPAGRRSRWVDYGTYELLEMISELEDERRWARLREGIWIAILVHLILISGITWIPKYILKVPPVVDPFEAIRQRKDDLKYLDLPPDLIKRAQPRAQVKPAPQKPPQIDKKTLEALNKAMPPQSAPTPAPKEEQPAPPPPPKPETQSQLEAPAPKPAPERPTFAMGSQNPADQLRDAMRGSRGPSTGADNAPNNPGMAMHPGAGGGVQVLSDTEGVDFNPWLRRWYFETEHTWDPLIPDEVNPPILKQGQCMIRFKVLPNGRIMEGSMVLEGRSGDTALDRAAWGALTGSNYPPLPREFHGPFLELRAIFMYNMRPQ
jgi:outer membrane biosynthesis protein TonB